MTEPPSRAAAPASTAEPQPAAGLPGPDLTTRYATCPGLRILEIAAAGRHHLALIGPDAVSAALARQLPDLLPDLDAHASAQVADLHHIAGLTRRAHHRPPWQEADQSLSIHALVGSPRRPGAVSLAHRGVLFAEHAAQWSASAVNALVHVLDNRRVALAPRGVVYPADLQVVLASTTCPHNKTRCDCPTPVHSRYLGRLTRLLDRVDVRLPLPGPAAHDPSGGTAAGLAARVTDARGRADTRWAHLESPGRTNHDATTSALAASLAGTSTTLLAPVRRLIDAGTVSKRAGIGMLRVAWTIADLHRHARPTAADIDEAIAIRTAAP